MSNSHTVKSLKADLTAANIAFGKKDNKAALEALLAAATAPVVEATPRKQRVSTKQILRDLFADVGFQMSVEDVVAHITAITPIQPATIVTMCGDLKNPKYAAGELIYIVRSGDNYVRVDAPKS